MAGTLEHDATATRATTPSRPTGRRVVAALCLVAVAIATVLAYRNTFHVPLVLDDLTAIGENKTIRDLSELRAVLSPPVAVGVGGRPVANLSFALNYAVSGLSVWSYHGLNLALHLAAGALLFGVVGRTLRRSRPVGSATLLGAAVAALWLLHPLQTNAVTYLSQRTELLAATFYLFALYAFVRGTASMHARFWFTAMIGGCLLAIGSKETAVTAPLMILLYDRTFVAGSFAVAWRARRGWYLGLAATWLPLAWLAQGLTLRGAGLGAGVSPWRYAVTSCGTLLHYLRLALWPRPLVFDYGPGLATPSAALWISAAAVVALAAGTLVALRYWPRLGFCCAWFLVLLAPTTSFVPVAFQPIAENRVYLPLAGLVVLAVVGLQARLGRWSALMLALIGVAYGVSTFERNRVYADAITLWTDTVEKRPRNDRALSHLGRALMEAGRAADAIPYAEAALEIDPRGKGYHGNLASALAKVGRLDEALALFQRELDLRPDDPDTLYNFGQALFQARRFEDAARVLTRSQQLRPDDALIAFALGNSRRELGQTDAAIAAYETALRWQPDLAEAHRNLGALLQRSGRAAEARSHLEAAVRLAADDPRAHEYLAEWLLAHGQPEEARQQLEVAVQLKPTRVEPRHGLAAALIQLGRMDEAMKQYEQILQLAPDDTSAHLKLGVLLAEADRFPAAKTHLEVVVRQNPDSADGWHYLGLVLASLGDFAGACDRFREAIRLRPNDAQVRNNFAQVLAQRGQTAEAIAQLETAVRLRPDYAEARENLARLRSGPPERTR